MPPTISNLFKVMIDSLDLPEKLETALGSCWVESSVNLPAAFQVTFRKSPLELMPTFSAQLRMGARVAIYAVADGQGKGIPLVTGVVTALETEYKEGEGSGSTVLRGLDHSFKMLRHRRAAGYRNMTADEIVAQLAERDGVTVGVIEKTRPQYDLITQPNISDWQFVQYLADVSDMEADFDDEGLLRFRKAKAAASGVAVGDAQTNPRVLEFDENMLWCRAGITASDQVSEVTSRGWNAAEKSLVLGRATALSSPDVAIGASPEQATSEFGAATLTETGTPYRTQPETDRAAASLAADITSAFAELEIAVRGQPDLVPGLVVALKSAGPPFDGAYTVSTTRHVFTEDNEYRTWVWVTGRQVRTLYGLASGGERPAPRIPGVVNAIVTDISDPAQQGRVKLRFPWFDDTYVTDWVRTVQFGGHKGGGVISHEVDDEVLVAFDRGVIDYPYVIGGLYSNADKPSDHDRDLHASGQLNRRSIVSPKGHRLEILDAPKQTGVRLRTGDEKLTVFLEQDNKTITISSEGTVSISGKTAVTISSDGDVAITAGGGEEPGTVSISGKTAVNVSSNGPLALHGSTVSISGAAVTVTGEVSMEGFVMIGGFAALNGGGAVTGDLLLNGDQVMVVPA